jgi:hypothetical protein
MTPEQVERLAILASQLTETLMTAAICANEIRVIIGADLDGSVAHGRGRPAGPPRPLVDASTLSIIWSGKTCPLHHTILFRLAESLARRPNQYITAEQLLRDVWENGVKSPDTIRSAVRRLRQRLGEAGMDDLAAAIHGTGGRYGLILDRAD